MEHSDFYKILKINKNATKEEIKRAYKKLAIQYHPDKNKHIEAPDMFRKIQIAYETLISDEKRKKYDDLGLTHDSYNLKKLFMYYQEIIIEVCNNYELTNSEKEEIILLFNPDDYEEELSRNDIQAANKKLIDNIMLHIKFFMIKNISKNHPYIGSTLEYILSWFN